MTGSRVEAAFAAARRLFGRAPRGLANDDPRRSSARDAIADLSEDSIAALDHRFRYIYFNDAYQREFKSLWGIDLALGASMIDMLQPWPDDLHNAKDLWSRALGGESFTDTVRFGPEAISKVYELRFHPLHDTAGRSFGAAHIVRDVTERHEQEQRLRVRERRADLLARLSDATRTLMDARAICAAAMRLLRESLEADRCVWADVELDEDHFTFAGADVAPGVPPVAGRYPVSAMGAEAIKDMRAGRVFVCIDAQKELPDGAERSAYAITGVRSLISTPLHKGGRFVAGTGVHMLTPRRWTSEEIELARAVTERCWESIERARAEVAMRDAERRKDEFLATLAHEMRNLLAPMSNGVSALKISEDPDARDRIYAIMTRQLRQFTRLLDDLVDVSHIARGQMELRRTRTELSAVLEQAIENCTPLLGERQLSLELPQQPVYLDADAARLTQVFSNLLHNACKSTGNDGHIVVSVENERATVTIRVKDDGAGIAAEDLERIFEMFVQVDSDARARSGLGIGLTLVRKLVELHGGTIDARSAGTGQGSEFIVRLRAIAGPSRQSEAPQPMHAGWEIPKLRVLVVDDNRDAAWSAATLLALWGHEVEVAYDGRSAIQMARQFRTQLMLLDLGMPDMDGYQVCRTLRDQPWADGISIVALTGWGQPEDRQRTYEAGFDAHLVKPVNEAALVALLTAPGPVWSRVPRKIPRISG